MSPESRQRFERSSMRKRPSTTPHDNVAREATPHDNVAREATLFSRQIINSEPQELTTASTFSDALAVHTSEGTPTGTTGSITQVVIPRSTRELLTEIASAWDLHPVLIDDLFHANHWAKVERYDDVLFVVLKSAVYIDAKEELRDALSQVLNVNSTLVAQRQNEDMKKISGWAAILFAPHPRRSDLRNELRRYARTPLGVRLPDSAGAHVRTRCCALRRLPSQEVDVSPVRMKRPLRFPCLVE
ncbi:hypothetical protein SAMN04489752_1264 [Brevibacterium siliguriense]|uniref:Uncharacterized protein n=1 Tax=Brevibacterium siliguriense TaxID=1136497 RepID=A0A1H1QIX2_9MICO|nr:hypothetical protein SAMN04489752_1264 [Brevibacterium siliguriense]